MNTQRFDCSMPGCTANFSRKADTLRHEEEKHGQMKFCPQPGCHYSGTKRTSRLNAHMGKKHPELYDVPLDVPQTFHPQVYQPGLQFYEESSQTQGTEHASTLGDSSGQQDFSHHVASQTDHGQVSADPTCPNQNFYTPTDPLQGVNQDAYYSLTPYSEFETPPASVFGYQAVVAHQTTLTPYSNAFGGTPSSMEGKAEEKDDISRNTSQNYSW